MRLLRKKERKVIIEEIMTHFHEDGIDRLNTAGYIARYTPHFHFQIAEPTNNSDLFISITELFGREGYGDQLHKNIRLQYFGNYLGLQQCVLLHISDSILPKIPDYEVGVKNNFSLFPTPMFQRLGKPTKDQKLTFDRSLLYLKTNVRNLVPESISHECWPEAFAYAYHI